MKNILKPNFQKLHLCIILLELNSTKFCATYSGNPYSIKIFLKLHSYFSKKVEQKASHPRRTILTTSDPESMDIKHWPFNQFDSVADYRVHISLWHDVCIHHMFSRILNTVKSRAVARLG